MRPKFKVCVTALLASLLCARGESQDQVSSEVPFFIENGSLRCTRVTVAFNGNILPTQRGTIIVDTARFPIQDRDLRELICRLSERYGLVSIRKTFPDIVWGDTLVLNKRTGQVSRVPDLSQNFSLDFGKPVPVDSVVLAFLRIPTVKYADQPISIRPLTTPNDPYFGSQWHLQTIQAPAAWDITTGLATKRIAIIDVSGQYQVQSHPDFQLPGGGNKFVGGDESTGNGHACWVAGIAGATTNNEVGVASVGWNTSLLGYYLNPETESETRLPELIYAALVPVQGDADVLNFSFETLIYNPGGRYCPHNFPEVEGAVSYALGLGAILVAAAGNDNIDGCPNGWVPYLAYPAAYTGVIAVSGTMMNDTFYDSYNYGNFVDIAAPAENVWGPWPYTRYSAHDGTSGATAQVSALAALMLAVDSTADVETIIKNTADKVDAVRFPYVDGWNDRLGHGRINAYRAVLLTLAGLNKSTLSTATAYGSARRALHESGILKAVFQSGEQLVYTSSADGGSTWTGQQFTNGNVLLGPNSNPSLLSRGGNLHSVFLDNGSSFYYIKTASGDWQSPHLLHETSALGTTSPSFAVDNAGFGHVTWVQTNIVRGATYYWVRHGTFNTADANPSLSNITTIYTSTSQSTSPSIAVNSSNKPHVVWSVNGEVYYSNKISGSWSTALNISNNAGASTRPAVATDGSQIFVAWQDATPTKTEVYYRRRSGAGVWDPGVTNISNSPTTSSNNPAIAFTTGFSVPYVAWEEEQSSLQLALPPDIKVKRADQPGSGTNISNTSGVSAYPTLAIEPQAGYCIWTEGSNVPFQIMAAPIFESLGPEGGVPSGAGSFSTQSFPNPFNPLTRIQYRLPRDVYVTLKVYDALGREVAILVNEFRTAGTHEAVFDATLLASGVYYYRLRAGEQTEVGKMILAK